MRSSTYAYRRRKRQDECDREGNQFFTVDKEAVRGWHEDAASPDEWKFCSLPTLALTRAREMCQMAVQNAELEPSIDI